MKIKFGLISTLLLLAIMLFISCKGKTSSTALPAMTSFSDSIYGYSIDYPVDWLTEQPVQNQFRASSPGLVNGNSDFGDNEAGIVVTIDTNKYPQEETDQKYYQDFLASARQSTSLKTLQEQSANTTRFGNNVSGYVANWIVTDEAGTWELKWFFANSRGSYFAVCVYSVQDAFEKYNPIFEAAINSFKFIPSPATNIYQEDLFITATIDRRP
jgi:hypothetical protein